MHLTPTEGAAWIDELRPLVADVEDRDLFVLPSFPAIFVARDHLAGTRIAWGAQDVHPEDSGAHTGDVSAPMLRDLGCRYVAVGHSERRRDHGEVPALIAAKVAAILRWSMTPILCVGEARQVSPEHALEEVLADLEACLAEVPTDALDRVVVAYEPVWAIGLGAHPASPEEVSTVHQGVHAWLAAAGGPSRPFRVIYGGSLDEDVAPRILAAAGVDGLFVGRRALNPRFFARIARTPVPVP
jgi:triosephosphate isomerase (TIM)